jgi:hypothetical protein
MSRAREDRSELSAHQVRTQNANSHAAPLSWYTLNPQSKSAQTQLTASGLWAGHPLAVNLRHLLLGVKRFGHMLGRKRRAALRAMLTISQDAFWSSTRVCNNRSI